MSKKETGPRLIFRNKRINASGEEIIEERELAGCTPDEIMNYLSAPWDIDEVVPSEEDPSISRLERFADTIAEKIQRFQMVVKESYTENGESSYVFSFSEEKRDEIKGERPAKSVVDAPVQLTGDVKMKLQGDLDAANVSMAENNNRIEVNNRALLLVNRDNVYAIVNLNLNLLIQQSPLNR